MLEAARAGQSVLLIAPTGAGKTLAGFLPSLVDLAAAPRAGLHTLYVSPLKALAVDVARNLTPSTTTGIGNWTLAQFTRALREEIGGDGRPLMPPMGRGRVWAAMTDQDIADLFAYFRSLPPLDQGLRGPWPCPTQAC